MFYDTHRKEFISDARMRERGLPFENRLALAQLGIFKVLLETVGYDPAWQGLEPVGDPRFSEADGYLLIQKMQAVNLLEKLVPGKLQELAQTRWEKQMAGILVDGVEVPTDPDNLSRMANAIQGMKAAGIPETAYKAANGWQKISLANLERYFALASRYVQECYINENNLAYALRNANTLEELNGVDIFSGWPDGGRPREDGERSTYLGEEIEYGPDGRPLSPEAAEAGKWQLP